ncbi:MAG TPA: energy transducer TonB [Caulobacteraceae bacterium]|jgi:protein TonB
MSEIRHRDPILDPPRRKGLGTAWVVGIAISVAVNGGIVLYVINQKFKLIPYTYHDKAVNVQLEKLPPPPPPPKKPPPPPPKAPPPPTVQPRVATPPPINIPTPPPAPLPPQIHPVPVQNTPPVVAPPAPAAPKPQAPAILTDPQWVRQPNGNDFVTFYPPQALEAGIEGHSSMECTVRADGTLTACHIISESPAGKGFGSAELRIASRFKMRPATRDGEPVEGHKVVIPLAWKVAG